MIYKKQQKVPHIHFVNEDFRSQIDAIAQMDNVIVVTDPPFNIGYHYGKYKDKMDETEYFEMLENIVSVFPSVIIHYPEALHELSVYMSKIPERVVSWVYNSNTPRQHRDIAYYGIKPDFKGAWQPYKNTSDKRIQDRIAQGIRGGGCMIGGMLIRLKTSVNVNHHIHVRCL